MGMDHFTSQNRISERIDKQSFGVPTHEMPKQVVNAPMPQVVEEIVGVAVPPILKNRRRRFSLGIIDQIMLFFCVREVVEDFVETENQIFLEPRIPKPTDNTKNDSSRRRFYLDTRVLPDDVFNCPVIFVGLFPTFAGKSTQHVRKQCAMWFYLNLGCPLQRSWG